MPYKIKEDVIAGNSSSSLKFLAVELDVIRKQEVTNEEYEQLSDSSKALLEEVVA